MAKHLTLSMIVAVAALGFTTPLLAQSRSAVSGAELDAAVAARPANNREAVQQFLTTDRARKVAGQMGVNASELSARVATLDQASLNMLAERTNVGDRVLVGGANTIVISTTAVIIALLIIILLVR
jgi:hypothetical protein